MKKCIAILFVMTIFSGCADYSIDHSGNFFPGSTAQDIQNKSKICFMGASCAEVYLWIFGPFGSSDVITAIQNPDINSERKKVYGSFLREGMKECQGEARPFYSRVNQFAAILWVYVNTCTEVYGIENRKPTFIDSDQK